MSRSDIEKVTALNKLDANGGKLRETAREMKLPVSTLKSWRDGDNINEVCIEMRTQQKRTLTDLLDEAAHTLAQNILDDINASPTGNLVQKSTALAILIDKHQLLAGQPTARTENGAPGDYSSKLDELRKKREERQKAG